MAICGAVGIFCQPLVLGVKRLAANLLPGLAHCLVATDALGSEQSAAVLALGALHVEDARARLVHAVHLSVAFEWTN